MSSHSIRKVCSTGKVIREYQKHLWKRVERQAPRFKEHEGPGPKSALRLADLRSRIVGSLLGDAYIMGMTFPEARSGDLNEITVLL
ncbi:hypothetical protein Holit_03051 [Hollandina sp. SP2]